MSSVRMCDKCGEIFSENELDWSNGQITIMTEDGPQTQRQDFCPACSKGKNRPRPRLRSILGKSEDDK